MRRPTEEKSTAVLVTRYIILGLLTAVILAVVVVQFWMVHLYAHSFRVFMGYGVGAESNAYAYRHVSRIREAGGEAVLWVTDSGAKAGIQAGDTIIAVNGVSLKENPRVFIRSFMGQRPGNRVELRVSRDGLTRDVSVVLENRERWLASQGYLGISGIPVTQQIADSLGLPSPTGVMVTDVSQRSPAGRAGIASGDVIVRFDGKEIEPGTGIPVGSASPGKTVVVEFLRDGKPLTTSATLSGRPSEMTWGFYGSKLTGNPRVVTWLYFLPFLLFPLLFLLTGCLIGWMKTKDAIAFECGVVLLLFGGAMTDYEFPFTAAWPDWAWVAWNTVAFTAIALLFPMAIRLLSIFPNPTGLGRRLLRWQWALFLFFFLWGFAQVMWEFVDLVRAPGEESPFLASGIILLANTLGRHWYFGALVGCVLLGSLLVAQRIETRKQPQTRLAVVEFGMLLVVLAGILFSLGDPLGGVVPSSVRPVYGYVVWYFPIVLFSAMPIAFAYTILTRRAFGIRFIIRKGLQHLLVSKGALLIGWLLVFWVVHQVLSHSNRWSDSVSAVSALAVGAAFVGTVGLRRVNVRLMRTIDRRFFREALDVRLMLSQLSGQLADLREGDKIHRLVASQVLAALHPSRVILLQRGQGEGDMESALVLESDRRSPSHEVRSPTSRISEAPVLLRSNDAAVQQVERDGWAAVAPETLDPQVEEESRLLQTGCELLIAIPASTGLIGVMGLGPKLSEEPFSGEDRDLLLTVARQAGMALENAELVEVAKREAQHAKELEIARNVQQNLFPRELPPREGWQFAAVCRPARAVGGDYYDVFEIDPTRVGLAIGDVSGKGLGPALMMSSIHAMTRSGLPPMAAEPSRFVESLNEHLVGSTSAEMFATFFIGVVDTTTGGLRYVNAGHNPPILLAGSSSEVSRLTDAGLIVGALSGVKYTDADMHMGDGDLLVLFSDGITEAMNKTGEMFEEERLLKEVIKARDCGRASEILSSIVDAVDRFAGEAEQADDMSVVVVMRNSCDHRPEAR